MRITILSALVALFITPITGQAYFTTDQGAVQLSDTIALYSITYSFGHDTYDLTLPTEAKRDSTDRNMIGYSFLINGEQDKVATNGSSLAFISSNTPVTDSVFTLPAGTAGSFTLYALLQTAATDSETDYSLAITSLPFTLEGLEKQLNPSELEAYITPEIELNEESEESKASIKITPTETPKKANNDFITEEYSI